MHPIESVVELNLGLPKTNPVASGQIGIGGPSKCTQVQRPNQRNTPPRGTCYTMRQQNNNNISWVLHKFKS